MLSVESSIFPQPSWQTERSRVVVDEIYGAIALFRRGTKLSQTSLSPIATPKQTASVPQNTSTPIVQSLIVSLSKLNNDFEQYSLLLAPSTRGNAPLVSEFKQLPLSTRLQQRNKAFSHIETTLTSGPVSGRVALKSQSLAQRISALNDAFVSGHAHLGEMSGNVQLTSSSQPAAPAPLDRATSLAARLQALNTSFERASVQTMIVASGSASLQSTPLDLPLASVLQNKSHQYNALEELVQKLPASVPLITSPSPLPVRLARLSTSFAAATDRVEALSGNVPLLSQSTEQRLVSNLQSLSNAFDVASKLLIRSSGAVALSSSPVKSAAAIATKLAALSDAYEDQTERAYLLSGLVPLLAAPPRTSPTALMSFPSLAKAISIVPQKLGRLSASPRMPRSLSAASFEDLLARSPSPIPSGRSPRPLPTTPLPTTASSRVRELARLDTHAPAPYSVLSPSSLCSEADTAWSVASPTSAGCPSCTVGSPIASPINHMCQCAVPELRMPPASEIVPSDGYRTARRHSVPDDLSTLSLYHFEMSEDTSRVKMRSLNYRILAAGGDVQYPLE